MVAFEKLFLGEFRNFLDLQSLTSVASKILEHIFHSSIMDHLANTYPSTPYSMGFGRKVAAKPNC